jgi:CxxC-x17-CxxC domain-containing protein
MVCYEEAFYLVKVKKGEKMGYQREPREMHKAVCSDCGQECEVPFKPAEGRPVYCRECYRKHRPKSGFRRDRD